MQTSAAMEALLERMPAEVGESLNPEQRAAICRALNPPSWNRHFPIHIRVSLPLPGTGRRYFLTVVGGWDRRNPTRIRRERMLYPLHTGGNLMFLLGMGMAFSGAVAVTIALARGFGF